MTKLQIKTKSGLVASMVMYTLLPDIKWQMNYQTKLHLSVHSIYTFEHYEQMYLQYFQKESINPASALQCSGWITTCTGKEYNNMYTKNYSMSLRQQPII